jgi:4-aminobutyrate aminotransferase / (S)-3-amino-2-methylpropionate transaminase / 5-aminovalerate transaminase
MLRNDRNSILLAERERHVPRGVVTAHPLVVARALGAHVWDVEGRRYLDFVAGIGVLNVGHNHPRVVAAVSAQLQAVTHTAFQVAASEPYIALAARLNRLVGDGKSYKSIFLTTGAEAVENAIKIARAYTCRSGVIAFHGGFHGRTLLGITLTGMSKPYRQNFGPFAPDVHHVPFPDAYRGISSDAVLTAVNELFLAAIAPDRVAAIIVEPVQGDGGFLPAPPEFLQGLRDIATRYGIVLVIDEIQTGFGRTGRMFGFQHAGIEPDLVTVAKSLAGGFPLSGVVGRADIMDAPSPGGLGGTYGGNAVACAAALAVLDAFEHDGVLEQGCARAEEMWQGLQAMHARFEPIGEARRLGLMQAIEFVSDRRAKTPDADMAQRVIDNAREGGLLVIKCGVHRNVVRFLAPLTASEADVAEALAILTVAIERATASH